MFSICMLFLLVECKSNFSFRRDFDEIYIFKCRQEINLSKGFVHIFFNTIFAARVKELLGKIIHLQIELILLVRVAISQKYD